MKSLKVFLLVVPVLLLAGCSIDFGSQNLRDGGVFKTNNHFQNWHQDVFAGLASNNKPQYIDEVTVRKIVTAPSDSRNVYLGTTNEGLYFSECSGGIWRKIFSTESAIRDIAIDYQSRKIIYLAVNNKVYKTVDLGENWEIIYTDKLPDQTVNSIATDPYDSRIVYAGISDGRLLKSVDYGSNWLNIHTISHSIKKILITPDDANVIYLATANNGIFHTKDAGVNWQEQDLKALKEQYPNIHKLNDVIFDPNKLNSLVIATKYGILFSNDYAQTWEAYQLVTPPSGVDISTIAVNTVNSDEIYYTVGNVLYVTYDNGLTWTNAILPTSRIITQLVVDSEDPDTIFFGTRLPPEEKGLFGF